MRSKDGVTGGEGDEGISFSLFDFCFIEALLYNEECHSERSPSLRLGLEPDCT